jgi:lipopolysaccharide/colanic/teichoic acid biosynthesis glycosyltransferase
MSFMGSGVGSIADTSSVIAYRRIGSHRIDAPDTDASAALAGVALSPRPAPSPPGGGQVPSLTAIRPRAVVIEPGPADPEHSCTADRLDQEFDVERLSSPHSVEDLAATLARHRPRWVLCKQSLDSIDATFLTICAAYDVETYILAQPVYGGFKPVRFRRFGGLPWLQIQRRRGRSGEWVKRAVDLALVLLSLPLSLPLMVMIALALSPSGSVLYFQDRIGAGGRPFRMVKFRSMPVNAEAATGPTLATADDARVTRLGRVLRRLRFDELPQLWNVLCGEMSLVGPRPERPEFVAELRHLRHYDLRHLVRPGLTGIAQLTGGYAATPDEKLRCDLLYLQSRSLRSDLGLLLLTVLELCRGFPRG